MERGNEMKITVAGVLIVLGGVLLLALVVSAIRGSEGESQ